MITGFIDPMNNRISIKSDKQQEMDFLVKLANDSKSNKTDVNIEIVNGGLYITYKPTKARFGATE